MRLVQCLRHAFGWGRLLPVLGLLAMFPDTAAVAATVAAADQNGGYSAKVLAQAVREWTPPPALKGEFEVRIKVALDDAGRLVQCGITKPSGLEALDASACGAVRKAGSFGTPPYGLPIDVHLVFWTGTPKSGMNSEPLSPAQKLMAEEKERAQTDRLIAGEKASIHEDIARQRAEAAAKAQGRELPEATVAPVDRPTAKSLGVADSQAKMGQKGGPSTGSGAKRQSSPVLVADSGDKAGARPQLSSGSGLSDDEKMLHIPLATPAQQEAAQNDNQAAIAKARAEEHARLKKQGSSKTDVAQEESRRRYISRVAYALRKAITVPKEAEPGRYQATVNISFERDGTITGAEIAKASTSRLIDKYILQGIQKTGKIETPPSFVGNSLELTFTIRR